MSLDFKKIFLGVAIFALYYLLTNYFFGYISPSMIIIGIPCPGCGLSRAGVLFLSGNFIESFQMHPLFIPSMLFLAYVGVYKIWPNKAKHIKAISIAFAALFFAVYVYRMVHFFPLQEPMVVNVDSILGTLFRLDLRVLNSA
ncbi:MAG: DUF2752 domain-containing protein [Turicibacter sp.]|nr:DUF2752 domain-containing protein [Turicibacter sp.]